MTNIMWFIRKGLVTLLTQNKALNNHPLNSVWGYFTSSLGYESLFTLRWHSVVLGVLAIAVIIRLAREWFGEYDALVVGLLITISPYHIVISQIARGYVGLVCFTALGYYLILQAVKTKRKRYWLGFVAVSVFNIYNHLYGAMAVGGIGLIALALLMDRELSRQPFQRVVTAVRSPLIPSLVVIYLVSLGLYWPMWADTISVAGQNNKFQESDLRRTETYTVSQLVSQPFIESIRPFSLAKDELRLRLGDPTLSYSFFDPIAALAESKGGFYFALGSFLLGIVFSWSKFRRQTLICLAWLILPFIMQLAANIILPGAYFRGRFLTFIYPPYLLLMARGWPGLADWLAVRVNPSLKLAARSVGWLGVSVLICLNLAWLGAYYSATINEHWADVAHYLAQNIQTNDIVYCGQRSDTACSFDLSVRLRRDVKELDDTFITFEEFRSNRAHFEQPGRVWVVLPHLKPWQIAALNEKLTPTYYGLFGNANYDRVGWIRIDSQPALGDNLAAALQFIGELSLNSEERYKNYLNLTKIHLAREQLAAAETDFAFASEPLSGEAGVLQQQQLAPIAQQLEYTRQAAHLAEQLPSTASPCNLTFGGLARLMAYQIDRSTVVPGGSLQVHLYWQPLAPIERNLVSYVYLTDLEAKLLGEARGIPGGGQTPTPSWQPGQLVVDTYTVSVAQKVQAPLAIKVEAGLFDPENSEFIKVFDSSGQKVNPTIVRLKVAPPVSSKPTYSLKANFADLINLVGYDLSSNPPGVVFHWQAQSIMDKDYTVFVHLLDDKGVLVGQIDGQPIAGNYPTSWWSPGEIITDQRQLPNITPGNYRLLVGWYNAADGLRLALADGSGDSLALGQVNVP